MSIPILFFPNNIQDFESIYLSNFSLFISYLLLPYLIHLNHKLESRLPGEISTTTLMAESKEELKGLLMKVNEESEKADLKLNIHKTKFIASGPITSWQIHRETMDTVTDFIFLSSQVTEDSDCSHEIERCLPLGRKAMTNLDSTLQSRDITLLTKVYIVKAVVFPIVMYGCESWTIKDSLIPRGIILSHQTGTLHCECTPVIHSTRHSTQYLE